MPGKNQHVLKRNGHWAVIGEGNSRATSTHKTQNEATKVATSIAKNQKSELIVHDKEGLISRRNSYGNDPYPPKG